MAKVAMCAGHGGSGSTPGKRSPAGEYEWNFNDAVVRAAIAKLKANGVEVLRTDDASGKTDVGLTARTNKANAWGADVYVSCHHNALGTNWLNYEIGIETFTQNGSQPQSEILARCIHPKYVKAMGLKDRGMKKSNLAITRQTKMPAVLTEGGFMDSRIDIKSMRDNAKLKAQGEAIADGIMEFLNVKNTNSAPKVSKPSPGKTGSKQITKPSSPTKTKWKKLTGNWTGQTLGNGEYGNPVNQLQTKLANNNPPFYPNKGAKNNGIDSYYGDDTEDAVRRFQSYYGLDVDGLAGKQVYNKLSGTSTKSNPKKSISQMATEVIAGKHGSGHENRRNSLGISKSEYEKVRKEVNKRL
ncbi:N-acetylmuramoyl-L-alanine amidase [Oceanobacillus sojae]|uniref:MurNAc-LAA domain-containing protein n=1 Tax=Oceanobacillus sojae TaxID=582851 RepID=A0A511ZIL2_9BACI|nr:N-acetylmuramoyl-L-alanine amidase [Oceanobacillus sojae]GEN87265.1 hypothetical protein OSO01_20040 [Oceanobacillus sojae]